MKEAGVEIIGCDPNPPDFSAIAKACAMPFHSCANDITAIKRVLESAASTSGPVLVEIQAF